jgi:hypothetical protein
MNKTAQIALILCFSIVITSLAGCIERHSEKTETVLAKLDSAENVQWTTLIENKDYASSQSVAISNRFIQTSDNGFVIAGFFFSSSGRSGIRLVKTDSGGNPVWEKRIPDLTGEILTLIQRRDGGYSVFCRDGHVFGFGPSGTLEGVKEISEQVNRTPSGRNPVVTLRSLTRISDENLIMVGNNYANIWQPVIIARLSQDGTVLTEKTYAKENAGERTSLIPTPDGGLLLGKYFYRDQPGGGKQILIEKTDANSTIVWDSPLGICNFTFCNNDLLGMHESANQGYDIIYQSQEQTNRSPGNMPVVTVYARLDNNGRVVQQELLTDVSGLPSWIFYQNDISSELIGLVPEEAMKAIMAEENLGNPTNRFDSLIRTDDGGYAIVGTRLYF